MHNQISRRFLTVFSLVTAIAISAGAQNITYTADPPRILVHSAGTTPLGLPECATNSPTSPTPDLLYCYTPGYIWTAYNILPVLSGGNFGQGQTIAIIDAFGSPTIQQDLATFHSAFFGNLFPRSGFRNCLCHGLPGVQCEECPAG